MPYVFATCTHCLKENSYDRAELDLTAGAYKGAPVYRSAAPQTEEFQVTCKHCQKKYKITLSR